MRIIFTTFLLFIGLLGYSQQNIPGADKSSAFAVTYESLRLFPNPVISNAVLEFKLSEPSRVQVTLHNILGAQIKSLITENLNPGKQSVQFSADQLLRGTYFLRLSINGEIIKTVRVAIAPQ
ncbi:MAG: T9SS type A sorting domain-containing protein [Saprospiraceae bacterium]